MQLSHFLMQLHGPYYGVKCKTKMKQRVFKEKEKLTVFAPHWWRLCVEGKIQVSQGRRRRSVPVCGIEAAGSMIQMHLSQSCPPRMRDISRRHLFLRIFKILSTQKCKKNNLNGYLTGHVLVQECVAIDRHAFPSKSYIKRECVCVCERERVRVCVCVSVRESGCVSVPERHI